MLFESENKTFFLPRKGKKRMIDKIRDQYSSKILSENYLASKFAPVGIPVQTRKVVCLHNGALL